MALPQSQLIFTEEQYLEFERSAEERHEYLDGHIYKMAGESGEHGDISANLVGIMVNQLRGTPCRARTKDTKVRSGPLPVNPRNTKGLYSYPDLVVICGEPQYLDDYRDVVINPKVIIEVLSDSTSEFDRIIKFERYRIWSKTLTDYVLISQTQPVIEHFEKRESGEWVYHPYRGLDQKITIKSIKCSLPTADGYDRVVFPPEAKTPLNKKIKPVKNRRKS
jgi:Uma2 family endonuclease